jgi:PST family polysaccharide transporter
MNDRAVGIYSAAANLTEMWYFIPMLIAPSVFPAVLNTKKKGEDLYAKRMQMLYDFMAFISILIAVTVFIFSKTIVHIFYGEQYLEASPVLSIYAWTTIPIFLGVASSQFLVAENLTKISFYRTLFGSIASIFLNLILIPRYGIKGAAWAVLISFVITVFSIFFFKRAVGHGLQLLRSLNPFRLISYIPVKKPS